MGIAMDLKKINGIRKRLINAANQIDDIKKTTITKYMKKLEEEFDLICQSEIDKFYSSYPNPRYNRYGDLFNTYKILVNKYSGEYIIKFNSAYMKYPHRADSETIFVNSFIEGYHGGAFRAKNFIGQPHPDNHTPYWKNPRTDYLTWLRPAKKSNSPYKEIIKRLKEKEEELDQELTNDVEESINKLITPIEKEINRYL